VFLLKNLRLYYLKLHVRKYTLRLKKIKNSKRVLKVYFSLEYFIDFFKTTSHHAQSSSR